MSPTTLISVLFLIAAGLTPKDVVLNEQPTEPVQLAVGQRLVIPLTYKPTTGGSWNIVSSGVPGLKLLSAKVLDRPSSGDRRPGSDSSVKQFVFVAARRGKFFVKLVYGQPWELKKGGKPWEIRSARVFVR